MSVSGVWAVPDDCGDRLLSSFNLDSLEVVEVCSLLDEAFPDSAIVIADFNKLTDVNSLIDFIISNGTPV